MSDFAGAVLLAAVPAALPCPRCTELAADPGRYSDTAHLHTSAELGVALLTQYVRAFRSDPVFWDVSWKTGERRAPVSVSEWAHTLRHGADPLGPLALAVRELDASPLARWQSAEDTRRAAYAAQQSAPTATERKRYRATAADAARARDALTPAVRDWHEAAAAAWHGWQLDQELAAGFPIPNETKVGLSWH